MPLSTFAPPPALAAFVDAFWVNTGGDHDDGARPLERGRELPTGTPGLVINLSKGESVQVYHPTAPQCGQRFAEAVIRGPYSEWYECEGSRALVQIGVHFKPGGAYPFFALPAGELHNTHLPLDALWGARVAELRERLLETQGPEAQVRLLAWALQARAVRPLEPHPAVAYALRTFHSAPHTCTIAQVADCVGLSHGRFVQVFRDAVGMSPKRYCRLRRFLEVLRRAHEEEAVAWAELAVACGYYDQAHLINDFRAFASMTPSAYTPGHMLGWSLPPAR
ncbi:MAG TPA: AraC family transcriptional regulator [Ktedonobacterales bacterium]|jgi:AraC-like DNA-binding protein